MVELTDTGHQSTEIKEAITEATDQLLPTNLLLPTVDLLLHTDLLTMDLPTVSKLTTTAEPSITLRPAPTQLIPTTPTTTSRLRTSTKSSSQL